MFQKQFSLGFLVLVLTAACILFAFYKPRPVNKSHDAQAAAVNDALVSIYPKGTNFKATSVDFNVFLGRKTTEFPRLFQVANELDK